VIASEVFFAREKQDLLDRMQKATQILPTQRTTYEKMSLSDLAGLAATMKPQVDLKVRGTGAVEGEPEGVQATRELTELVKARIAASEGKAMAYGEAMRLVLSDRPDLERAYKATMGGHK
jgi:hypothetical protein